MFVTLIRVISKKEKQVFIFVPDNLIFIPYSFVGKYIEQVIVYPNIKIKDAWNSYKKQQKAPLFNYSKQLKFLVTSLFDVELYEAIFKRSDFYVFNDGVPFVTFLMLSYGKQNFTLIEEGELTYSVPKLGMRYYYKKLIGFPPALGYSRYINKLEVRYPDRLPRKTNKKAVLFDIEELMNKLRSDQKRELFNFFAFDTSLKLESPSLLLLPQPLAEDDIISEDDKIKLYKQMVLPYLTSHRIYVKPHPKEKTDYTKHFSNCVVLPKESPSELYHFLDLEFDIALTLFSTAIHAIPAKKHLFLGLDYAPEVKANWMKKMDVQEKR